MGIQRNVVIATLLVMVAYGTIAVLLVRRGGGDVSRLVLAGDEFTDPAAAPPGLAVGTHAPGYDGQFYYRLAAATWSVSDRAAGIRFDYPVYRVQRIGYPLLVRIVSGGNVRAIPWAMLLLNIVAAGVIAGTAATMVPRWWAAVAVALFPGFLLTMSRDLVELVEIALLLLALRSLGKRSLWPAVAFMTCAALTKETAILFAMAAGVVTLVRAGAFAIPVAAYAGWKLWLFHRWHLPPNLGASDHFTLPFTGMASALRNPDRVFVLEVALLALFSAAVVLAAWSSRATATVKLACVAYAMLLFSLGADFWWEDWSFLRAGTDYAVLGTIIALESDRWRVPVTLLVVASWLAMAAHLL
jgi:hypothetical protein